MYITRKNEVEGKEPFPGRSSKDFIELCKDEAEDSRTRNEQHNAEHLQQDKILIQTEVE
jgi:hypothetical protein